MSTPSSRRSLASWLRLQAEPRRPIPLPLTLPLPARAGRGGPGAGSRRATMAPPRCCKNAARKASNRRPRPLSPQERGEGALAPARAEQQWRLLVAARAQPAKLRTAVAAPLPAFAGRGKVRGAGGIGRDRREKPDARTSRLPHVMAAVSLGVRERLARGASMVDFKDGAGVRRWFDAIKPAGRRREIAATMAARTALRVPPLLRQ